MKMIHRISTIFLAVFISLSMSIISYKVYAASNEQITVEPRGEITPCVCGQYMHYIGSVTISDVTFRKEKCDSCNRIEYFLFVLCDCGGQLRTMGTQVAGGISYRAIYCEDCETWFYCDLN